VDRYDRFDDPALDDADDYRYDPGDPYDDYDDRRDGSGRGSRRPRRRRRRVLPKLLVLLVVLAVVLGVGIYAAGSLLPHKGDAGPPADYPGPGTAEADVTVVAGDSLTDIADTLYSKGVTASRKAFVNAAAANPNAEKIQPGRYSLKSKMSAVQALTALLDPKNDSLRFTITEGETVQAVLRELSSRTGVPVATYEAIVHSPAGRLQLPSYANGIVEGYLYPSTYELEPDATPAQTLQMFINEFTEQAAGLGLVPAAAKLGVPPTQVVIIASILEKEVKNPPEYPMAARVIYNRLADQQDFPTLGMDATTRYAEDNYEGPLTQSQLTSDNPYNTRKNPGLPPGAISNPGHLALQSALNPDPGSWNYFVSLPTGETKFATTAAEFNQLLAEYHADGGTLGG
jgi:UPF0755 protein